MNKKNIAFIIFAALLIAFTYCKHIPDFPLQPVIKFNSMGVVKSGSSIQALRLELDFTDGDGDLGLNSEDTTSPYDPQNDVLKNPQNDDFYNYFYTFLIQDKDSLFKECADIPECNEISFTTHYTVPGVAMGDSVTIISKDTTETLGQIFKRAGKARYPYLRPDSKKSPLSGVLTYDILLPDYILKKKIKLTSVYIKDRALNKSNLLETDTITIR